MSSCRYEMRSYDYQPDQQLKINGKKKWRLHRNLSNSKFYLKKLRQKVEPFDSCPAVGKLILFSVSWLTLGMCLLINLTKRARCFTLSNALITGLRHTNLPCCTFYIKWSSWAYKTMWTWTFSIPYWLSLIKRKYSKRSSMHFSKIFDKTLLTAIYRGLPRTLLQVIALVR